MAEQVPTDHFGNELRIDTGRPIIYKIQSMASTFYVHAPPFDSANPPAIVALPEADENSVECKWLVERFGKDGRGHDLFTIQNVGTKMYACRSDSPKEGALVVEGTTECKWKLVNQGDGHFAVTTAEDSEDILTWVEDDSEQKAIILHSPDTVPSSKERGHFRFYALRGYG